MKSSCKPQAPVDTSVVRDAHVFSFVWLYRQSNESLGLFVCAGYRSLGACACMYFSFINGLSC
jgi:hypothetical protein